jgi:hypothetical protein
VVPENRIQFRTFCKNSSACKLDVFHGINKSHEQEIYK